MFTLVAVVAASWTALAPVAVFLDLTLFLVGCSVFAWALLRAIGRSRDEVISLGGLFFLIDGVAPRRVAVALWGCVAVQVIVAVATAAVRPFSELAFGVLVPMFGLASLAAWGAIHGDFPQRVPKSVE